MAANLHVTLVRYFEAQNDHDADGMAACFAPDAQVLDEGQIHAGREAIREWKLDTIAKYAISIEPLSSTHEGDVHTAAARVSGNFPGSPANLTYDFELEAEGLIRKLEIH